MNLAPLMAAVLAVPVVLFGADSSPAPRERIRLDEGWRFALGHATDHARDFDFETGYFSDEAKAGYGDGPAAPQFDDRGWRVLDLPHDWAVEAPYSPNTNASHGFKAIGRNHPERSIGWYRKTLVIPESDVGRRISIEFEGVYRDSVVWVNGFRCGRHPSGYSSFQYDITDYLNYGDENVIVVRADASKEEGWFYEGAGIYRHVWLNKTAPLRVEPWGTAVTTDGDATSARVHARVTLRNYGKSPAHFQLEHTIVDPDGRTAASTTLRNLSLGGGGTRDVSATLFVPQPRLWSIETPTLHRLRTVIRSDEKVVDTYDTTFGIRTVVFEPDRGFFLNGRHVLLKGMNMHQDFAGVGVAVPDGAFEYILTRLRWMGVNAVRSAHNPMTPSFLDACDRMGFLVIDENRVMGSNPAQLQELERMIVRDRNHPSVILWSIGNEEWAIEGNVKGARIASTMQDHVRITDPSRRIVAANSGGWGGISSVIDIIGYNYINQCNPDEQHAKYPQQPGVGTEETTTQGTRGVWFDDRPNVHLGPQQRGDSGGNTEKGWKYYAERPFLAGVFFWTGLDFRGEPTPFGWPAISSQFGLLDTCGIAKDSAYYLKSWWNPAPELHLAPHWNWAGREGQEITVHCFSNDEAVELLLNGTSLGKQDMPRNGHLEWKVPYTPGTLEARGFRQGALRATKRVETTGPAATLELSTDRRSFGGDRNDIAVVLVCARDAQGRVVPTANPLAAFSITGGRILGVGNGDPGCHEPATFLPTISSLQFDEWRGRIVAAGTPRVADPATLEPMIRLGNWLSPRPKAGEVYELTGQFMLSAEQLAAAVPGSGNGAVLDLHLPSLGTKTSVWLNGHALVQDHDSSKQGPALRLDPALLVSGNNRVHLIVEPVIDWKNRIPEKTRIGSVTFTTPAPQPKRSLFNGWAAVVVQSAGKGPVTVRATSAQLAPAELTIAD